MPVDKVKPLKIENSATGGTEVDLYPTEADPAEDYLAAKGVALENSDDHRLEKVSDEVAFVDPINATKKVSDLLDAEQENFDPTGTSLVSVKTGPALRELYQLANGTSRGYTFAQYNGNANTGRYLEFFSGIASTDAPLYTPTPIEVLTVVAATTGANATCTLGWYDQSGGTPGTLLHITTFNNQKRVIEDGTPLFSIAANAELAIKVDSGSIAKPHLYFIIKGA